MSRYNRHIILSEIGSKGQEALSKSKVLVIGAGGLGCPVLQYLAAAGVGILGIVDDDIVEISNLQRQVLYGASSLGSNKSEAAKARLEDLNSDINIVSHPYRLTKDNALDLFSAYDIIVDASDNFSTRYLINDASLSLGKPLVYAAIYKFDGQVSVFNLQGGPSYRCLFPNPPKEGKVSSCEELGVLGVLPGIIGTMQANEVLKLILGIGELLDAKLLVYNALNFSSMTIDVAKDEEQIARIKNLKGNLNSIDYNFTCEIEESKIISVDELKNINDFNLIDVREIYEHPKLDLEHYSLPMSSIHNADINLVDSNKKTLILCNSGIKSKSAIKVLETKGFNKLYNLEGGINKLLEEGILQY